MRRARKWMLWGGGALLLLLLLVAGAGVTVFRTQWFRDKVRDRLIGEIERASGGRTEIGQFLYDWKTLTFTVSPFVLHGTEAATEAPLFRADRIEVRLKILSAWRRDVDLESLLIDKPSLHFITYPDGHTNLPQPKIARKPGGDPMEQLLKLAIRHIELRQGEAHFADRKIPLDLTADNLSAKLDYELTGPRYRTVVSMDRLRLAGEKLGPAQVGVDFDAWLERDRLTVPRLHAATGKSVVDASNGIVRFRPFEVTIDFRGHAAMADLGEPLRLPRPHRGDGDFTGRFALHGTGDFLVHAEVEGRGLEIQQPEVHIAGISLRTRVEVSNQGLKTQNLQVSALAGTFRGTASMSEGFHRFEAAGEVAGVSLAAVNQIQHQVGITYRGVLSGPVKVRGEIPAGGRVRNTVVEGQLTLGPGDGPHPARGNIDLTYDQRAAAVRLGHSRVELPSTWLEVWGTLGERLEVKAHSSNLDDVMPAIAMFSKEPPTPLPVQIAPHGSAQFTGVVSGPLASPRITGNGTADAVLVQKRRVDHVEGTLDLARDQLRLTNLNVRQDHADARGKLSLGLADWKVVDRSPLEASVEVRNVDLTKLAVEAGKTSPVKGTLHAALSLTGTFGEPEGTARVTVDHPAGFEEQFDSARGDIKFTAGSVEVVDGRLERGPARLQFSGIYQHAKNDWSNGKTRFSASSTGFTLTQFANVQARQPGAGGRIALKATGTADIRNGEFLVTNLNGQVGLQQLTLDGKPVGNLVVDASTNGTVLLVAANGDVRGAKLTGQGEWRLEGDYPGKGQAKLAPLDFRTIYDLAPTAARPQAEKPPVQGLLEANLTFSGPARKPDEMRARLEIPRLLVRAAETRDRTAQEIQDLTLRNTAPIVLEYERGAAVVRSASFVGKDTNVQIEGAIALKDKALWDLRVKGHLDLAALRDFNPDVEASGGTVLDAQVKGPLGNPQLSGSLRLENIAANLRGVPTGIDKGNGVILFQNNRAVIQKLTAEVGGGRLSFTGFVGYANAQAVYRLQATADEVRVRTEGVSTTVNANVNLSGTTAASLLTGSLTVRKAGFTPKTDVGSLLAEYAKPLQTPAAPNETMRNMQLDVHIDTAPGLMFQTSLTKDIQAEADLRLRGTAAKPSLLGRVGVTQGEINFFGSNYEINRGDVLFLNPTKIEPVLDLDLQTTARGVVVTINFSGTLQKMNVSYRSDPPLQSSEIIALLTVGRAPDSNPALASSQVASSQSLFSTGANTILGQAVAAPVSSRLQRFFGVSRLKIDPLLTDVTSVPQARLTLEQQISKDVTLTYITNLNKTQEQIVRLQWDLNRRWSLIAVRDENGLFGIDFQYRKRFK